jgi:hypothetical protein
MNVMVDFPLFGSRPYRSQRLQEGDQRCSILTAELQAELVSRYGTVLYFVTFEPRRNEVIAKTCGVEPLFECRHRAVVAKASAIPYAS